MKKLPALIMIIILLLNVATVAHAGCTEELEKPNSQAIDLVDSSGGEEDDLAICDCVGCNCHHSHSFLPKIQSVSFSANSQINYIWNNNIDVSKFQYPLSKPPKA